MFDKNNIIQGFKKKKKNRAENSAYIISVKVKS
jgi:hypothetical protein